MKRGQMKLSFGMIFSIILIVIFVAFAFYAISKFLDLQNSAQISRFEHGLQEDVNKIWKGLQGSEEVEYFLPKKINAVCFTNDAYENMFFRSDEFIQGRNIEHVDLEKITERGDPFCIENSDGKIKITLEQDFGENLVTIQ